MFGPDIPDSTEIDDGGPRKDPMIAILDRENARLQSLLNEERAKVARLQRKLTIIQLIRGRQRPRAEDEDLDDP